MAPNWCCPRTRCSAADASAERFLRWWYLRDVAVKSDVPFLVDAIHVLFTISATFSDPPTSPSLRAILHQGSQASCSLTNSESAMKFHRIMFVTASVLLVASAFTAQASEQPLRDPSDDAICVDAFSRSPAAASCQLTKVEYRAGSGGTCHLWAGCRRDDGSSVAAFGSFSADSVYRVCNKDGKLVAGCPG